MAATVLPTEGRASIAGPTGPPGETPATTAMPTGDRPTGRMAPATPMGREEAPHRGTTGRGALPDGGAATLRGIMDRAALADIAGALPLGAAAPAALPGGGGAPLPGEVVRARFMVHTGAQVHGGDRKLRTPSKSERALQPG
jgi:hypothetical protein